MNIPVFDKNGKQIREEQLELPDIKMSDYELAQIMRVYETNIHQGTKSVKTRGEVAYSKRKPWRQKGTGRARAGNRGSPIWIGGGKAHAPKPHQKRLTVNLKQKRRAFIYLLKLHLLKNNVIVLDLEKQEIKTKQAKEIAHKLGFLPTKFMYVADIDDNASVLGFRNLKHATIRRAELLSPRDIMKNIKLVLTSKALEVIKSRIAKYE